MMQHNFFMGVALKQVSFTWSLLEMNSLNMLCFWLCGKFMISEILEGQTSHIPNLYFQYSLTLMMAK